MLRVCTSKLNSHPSGEACWGLASLFVERRARGRECAGGDPGDGLAGSQCGPVRRSTRRCVLSFLVASAQQGIAERRLTLLIVASWSSRVPRVDVFMLHDV